MATLYDVPADELIDELATRLADDIEQPDWMPYAKTGEGRELPPAQDDFWHRRAGSILRKLAINGPIGVERLSTYYGDAKQGSTRYRVAPNHKTDGSKNIIRTILQQLEDAGYVAEAGSEGRTVTAEGRSFLDAAAGDVLEDLDRPELERYA